MGRSWQCGSPASSTAWALRDALMWRAPGFLSITSVHPLAPLVLYFTKAGDELSSMRYDSHSRLRQICFVIHTVLSRAELVMDVSHRNLNNEVVI